MSLLPKIEELCKAAAMVDPSDLTALVSMHDRLAALGAELVSVDLDAIGQCLEHASKLVEEIVFRESQNANASLALVCRGIEYAQSALIADEQGQSISDIGPSPFAATDSTHSPAPAVDEQLLEAWLSDCTHALNDLEAHSTGFATSSDPAAVIAEIRRGLHTLKGECGVLPLPIAQKVCHEAESAIDRCIETGATLPVDGILSVIDWLRTYSAALRGDAHAHAPAHDQVLMGLVGTGLSSGMSAGAISPVNLVESRAPDTERESESADQPGAPAEPADEDSMPISFSTDADVGENLPEFLAESREHLSNSEQSLLELEKQPGNTELINTVFRAFHTMKGVAGFMNLKPIVELAHHGECLLDGARGGKIKLDAERLDVILKACDLMTQLLGALEGRTPPTKGRFDAMIRRLQAAAIDGKPALGTLTLAVTRSAAAPGMNVPVSAPAAVRSAPPCSPSATPTSLPVLALPEKTATTAPSSPASGTKPADQTVKVSTGRMDILVDMVGELVIAQQMVVQDPEVRSITEQRLQRNLSMVGKIIRDLQAVSMSLRMVPIKATFQKMARLVRDVSAKAGKRINLHTEGEDVELDRNVVEVIADPLVHMIRNSCDHGIETPEVRASAGKPDTGNVWLRAYHSGGSIVVEIEDDGKGLDRNKIVAKAVEKGIYSPDRPVAEIPDAEVFNLVFLPGFSTAEKVTDISGRGVGMDVVRRNIEALRGKVDIRSVAGKGTVFSMRLPLTMAIIDGMVVRVGAQRYVIPTLSIEQSFRPRPKDLHSIVGKGEMAMVRDGLLPIFRLSRVLGHSPDASNASDDLLVVVETQDTRACLGVDAILGQQQVVIKSLGQGTQSIRGVSGGAILGDGRVALILDIAGILTQATTGV